MIALKCHNHLSQVIEIKDKYAVYTILMYVYVCPCVANHFNVISIQNRMLYVMVWIMMCFTYCSEGPEVAATQFEQDRTTLYSKPYMCFELRSISFIVHRTILRGLLERHELCQEKRSVFHSYWCCHTSV